MQPRPRLKIVAVLRCAAFAPEPVAADDAVGLALSVYRGLPPAVADDLAEPIVGELLAHGFAAGPEARALIESRVSRPGKVGELSVSELQDGVRDGYQRFVEGEFEACIEALRPLLSKLHQNSSWVAEQRGLKLAHMEALIGLGLSYSRLGREKQAAAIIEEYIRSFPDKSIDYREYGPEPVRLRHRVATEMQKRGTGRLLVEAEEETDVIFVNERFGGTGRYQVSVSVGGPYRVFVRRGRQSSRVRDVWVERDRTNRVVVDWAFDRAIRTEGRWAGLSLPEASDRTNDAVALAYGTLLGRSVGVPKVALIAYQPGNGAPKLVGTLISSEGHVVRRARLSNPETRSGQERAELGRFLATGEAGPALEVVDVPTIRADITRSSSPGFSHWKWITLTWAGVLAAGGVALYAVDGTCETQDASCPVLRRNGKPYMWSAFALAIASGVASGYLFWSDGRRDLRMAVSPTAGGVGVWARYDF